MTFEIFVSILVGLLVATVLLDSWIEWRKHRRWRERRKP